MSIDLSHPLVVGFGITGQAVATALLAKGHKAVVADDRPSEDAKALLQSMGLTLEEAPTDDRLRQIVAESSVVLPSPGIPASHPLFSIAATTETPMRSEFDLAALWDDRPLVGITGTNGKTTVTMLVTDALQRSGRPAAAVGNTEVPLVAALNNHETEIFVVEASSFRLAHSDAFAPAVATWLNFSPDHLDAHPSLDAYESAKASMWANLPGDAVVVANAEDPVVLSHLPLGVEARTFGLDTGEWRRDGDQLVGPSGPVIAIADLPRRQPHDLSNACAVAATAAAAGANIGAIAETLAEFHGLPHRLEYLGEKDGVGWYNDSKATVPHATVAAVSGFDSVVLIAGGRNKGLELTPLRSTVPPVRTVVATGDAAAEVADVFGDLVPVLKADSMTEAIDLAAEQSRQGDTVLLSPACTSYDWYRSYVDRGTDFTRLVKERLL